MIPQRNISLIANTLVKETGQRIPEAVIERDYILAWFLSGLAEHPLRDVLAFKGGTALRRCWIEGYRFSEDMDFTLVTPTILENILAGLDEIFAAIETASGLHIAFDREDRHSHQNSHTFYLNYQGPFPPRTMSRLISRLMKCCVSRCRNARSYRRMTCLAIYPKASR